MKTRNGFVSNSSSSSFVILKYEISARQLDQIIDHARECQAYGMSCSDDEVWNIDHYDTHTVRGNTDMDNFDMRGFFQHIGVNLDMIKWGS